MIDAAAILRSFNRLSEVGKQLVQIGKVGSLFDGGANLRRGGEIHIRHPHGQLVFRNVPFEGVGVSPIRNDKQREETAGADTSVNAVAPGATVTPAHLANKADEQPGGSEMLNYSGHYVYFPGPECDPMDQAYACLYLASKMGVHVKGQVLRVCNGAFL